MIRVKRRNNMKEISKHEELESYSEYKSRRFNNWNERINDIIIDIKNSSLREIDKKRIKEKLNKQLI